MDKFMIVCAGKFVISTTSVQSAFNLCSGGYIRFVVVSFNSQLVIEKWLMELFHAQPSYINLNLSSV